MGPQRTCIGCRSTRPAGQLVRVVRHDDGSLLVGRSLPGRGAWLCRDSPGCVDQAEKRRAFERALRGPVGERQVDQIRSALGVPTGEKPGKGSESRAL